MALESLLARLERRLEEQEIAAAVEKARRHRKAHGLPYDAQVDQNVADYERIRRTWPAEDFDQALERACQWWADRLGIDPAEVLAEAERLADECTAECPDEH